jgi:hypothetical protein
MRVESYLVTSIKQIEKHVPVLIKNRWLSSIMKGTQRPCQPERLTRCQLNFIADTKHGGYSHFKGIGETFRVADKTYMDARHYPASPQVD